MAFESWDDAMFWHGSLIGYMAGVKSACKDEDKSSLLLRMADTQARLEFMESENAKLRDALKALMMGTNTELCAGRDEPDCKKCSMHHGKDGCAMIDAMELLCIDIFGEPMEVEP